MRYLLCLVCAVSSAWIAAGSMQCDFEKDLCGWTVEKNHTTGVFDVMEWRQGEAIEKQEFYQQKLLTFGPDGDHTSGTQTGKFMFAVRPINAGTKTSLVSPVGRGQMCDFSFFYYMGSTTLADVNIYVIKYGEKIKLGTISGYHGSVWNRALFDIAKYTEFGDYQFAIEATEPHSAYWTVGYAIDDVKAVECNQKIECDFETDMCGFEIDRDNSIWDPMVWTRGQTKTHSWFGEINTIRDGPPVDHTVGNSKGYFAYAVKPLGEGTDASMRSPMQDRQLCYLEFYYFMHFKSLTGFAVIVRTMEDEYVVFNVTGDQGDSWNQALVSIEDETKSGRYELMFLALEPGDIYWSVGYAIDDVKTYGCECASSPCQNGGKCTNIFKDYNCTCPQYFVGKNCETDTNPCLSAPCSNEGTCTPKGDNFTCACKPGWTGHKCEVNIDECASSPCVNGSCADAVNGFTCNCTAGFSGTLCDVDIDECKSNPCQNGANCTEGINSYACACLAGYTGNQCQTNINECASGPCHNGGTCEDDINEFHCICNNDYAGLFCEIRNTVDCNFEDDFCGYTTSQGSSNDSLKWERGTVSKPGAFGLSRVLFMGPSVDHTKGTAKGHVAFAKRTSDNSSTAIMTSPLQQGRLCYIEFFYHLGSTALRDLNVYILKNGTKELIFIASGYQGYEWQRAMIYIHDYTTTGLYQIIFEVDQPDDSFTDTGYAIDDIKGINCDLSLDCDFENGTCNYLIERDNNYYDRMEWRRGSAVLETVYSDIKLLRNGPDGDHTTGLKNGKFMYAVRPINSGTNTTLLSPRQRRPMCFIQFYYHMGSRFLNDLVVSIRKRETTFTVFNVNGFQGHDWQRALIDISELTSTGEFEIAIYVNDPDDDAWTVGYAVDDISGSSCFCKSNPCLNGGNCTNLYRDFNCTCPYLFTGQVCETKLHPCDLTPCANAGVCSNLPDDKFSCACLTGWTGTLCDEDLDECASNPCQHGGKCTDKFNGFTCSCEAGYFGRECEQEVDECISNPCQNGAECVDEVNFYTCKCKPGYFGVYCQFDIDECASSPCQNGATCVDDINFYSCRCAPGYTGGNCQSEIDECASTPCANGGWCVDRVAAYSCYCKPGYSGTTCTTDVNECWSSPCQHGGTCMDRENTFLCRCPIAYKGDRCELEVDECQSNPCKNGATCHDKVGGFLCDCRSGFAGTLCEKSLHDCGTDPC